MNRIIFHPTGKTSVAIHTRRTIKGETKRKVLIKHTVPCKGRITTDTLPPGILISRAMPHPVQPMTYRPNGAREVARRLRQMETRS